MHETAVEKRKVTHHKILPQDVHYFTFQGGSVKGLAYVGANLALIQQGVTMKQIKAVAGTSAGAITALVLALGYKQDQIQNLMEKLNFKDFLDSDKRNIKEFFLHLKDKKGAALVSGLASHSLNSTASQASLVLNKSFGLFKGEYFRKWAEDLIRDKVRIHAHDINPQGNPDYLTFAELHQLHMKHPETYKDLYVVGMNANTHQAHVFSHKHTPQVIISDAVRISMSIPFLFVPHQRYVKESVAGVSMRVLEQKQGGELYIDGGITNNCPDFIFDDYEYLPEELQKTLPTRTRCANPTSLAFRLFTQTLPSEKTSIEKALLESKDVEEIKALWPYIKAVLACIYDKQQSDYVLAKDEWRSICINVGNISMLDFDLTPEQKQQLILAGEAAVKGYFDTAKLHAGVVSSSVDYTKFLISNSNSNSSDSSPPSVINSDNKSIEKEIIALAYTLATAEGKSLAEILALWETEAEQRKTVAMTAKR